MDLQKYGYPGWSYTLIAYKYDLPLRIGTIDKALSRLGIEGNIHALDIGLGVEVVIKNEWGEPEWRKINQF